MRQQFNLPEWVWEDSPENKFECNDYIAYCVCPYLALCQDARQLKALKASEQWQDFSAGLADT